MRVGISEFKPSRLSQIRQHAGVTKSGIAEGLGVSPATVSKWESGNQLPTIEKIRALSLFFGVQERFFMKATPELQERTAFFRSMANATKTARQVARIKIDWVAEISHFLGSWIDWPEIRIPVLDSYNILDLSNSDIEKIASQCRELMGLGNTPVQNVVLALESSGIICACDSLGYSNMDGLSLWSSLTDRPYVFIGRDKANPIRNRFDAAHELGHVVLHRMVDRITFRKFYKEIERQADYFAGAFLLPPETFSNDINFPNLDSLLSLKKRWKVSVASMIMRCYQLGIIDDIDKIRLFKGRSSRGWTRGEPLDNEFEYESPRLLSRAFEMVHNHDVVSKEQTLYSIGLPAKEIEKLSGLPRGYFSQSDFKDELEVKLKSDFRNNVVDFGSYR